MRFEFSTAKRIIFGPGTIEEVAPLAAEMGHRSFVVAGHTLKRAAGLLEQLNKQGIECLTFNVPGEPTTTIVLKGVQLARQAECDFVIGIGGGSVIDTGKVIAALMTNSGEPMDYLEVIGHGQALSQKPAPYIAIPTTSGTGAEVTRNAVLGSLEHGVKVSMRSPLMLPRVSVVDPVLTYSMPPTVTATTGLDALTHLMEAYVSNKTNPLTDSICREGIKRTARSLRLTYEDGSNKPAREDMSLASLFGGLALANAKLGAVHGLAAPLGGISFAPHGLICARLLPHVMEANVHSLQTSAPSSPALARYDEVAQILTGTNTARAADGVAWVQDLCAALKMPSLSKFGLEEKNFPTVVAKAQKASSMKGNPIILTDEELIEILRKAI
ncbi:MAG: iron-containing alcohol dehydrogenase [Deltaproteobacteria bacterium]|nr:iron-containing alcohol dehydrogenase [Deltaproteobacteria bacterium]